MSNQNRIADGESILTALGACADGIGAGLFLYDEATHKLELKNVVGFLDQIDQRRLSIRVTSVEDEQSLVGSVGRLAEAVYVPDCEAEPRWKLACTTIRSAYMIPLSDTAPCSVLAFYSRELDGFDASHRALADALVRFAIAQRGSSSDAEQKVEQLEGGLRSIAVRLEELGVWAESERRPLPEELRGELRSLTPREWEVFRSFSRGHRVSTISRNMAISTHTVRNHLKSIFRKLKVRSQAELSERIRPWDLPQDIVS